MKEALIVSAAHTGVAKPGKATFNLTHGATPDGRVRFGIA